MKDRFAWLISKAETVRCENPKGGKQLMKNQNVD